MSLTRTRLITTTALATVLIAGCGGSEPTAGPGPTVAPPITARPATPSPSATPSKPAESIAGLSAQQIIKRTKAALKAAVSVRVRGGYTDEGTPVKLDVSLARTASAGTVSYNGAGVKFLVIGRTAYLQFSDAFWRQNIEPRKEADELMQLTRGKWLKVAVTDKIFSDMGMAFLASKPAFVSAMLDSSDWGRKIGTRTIGGIACIGLAGDDHRTLWVDATSARPIRLDTPGRSGTESLTFSEYNQIKQPTAPPAAQVVDGRAFGLTGGRQAAGVQGRWPRRRVACEAQQRGRGSAVADGAPARAPGDLRGEHRGQQRPLHGQRGTADYCAPSTDVRHASVN